MCAFACVYKIAMLYIKMCIVKVIHSQKNLTKFGGGDTYSHYPEIIMLTFPLLCTVSHSLEHPICVKLNVDLLNSIVRCYNLFHWFLLLDAQAVSSFFLLQL